MLDIQIAAQFSVVWIEACFFGYGYLIATARFVKKTILHRMASETLLKKIIVGLSLNYLFCSMDLFVCRSICLSLSQCHIVLITVAL